MRNLQLPVLALVPAQPQACTRLVRGCKLQTNRIHGSLRLEAGMANASMFIISLIYVALSQAPGRWFKTWPAFEESAVARSGGGVFFTKEPFARHLYGLKRAPWRPGVIFDAHFLFLLLFSLRGKRRGEGEEGSSDRNLGVEDDRLDRKIEIVTLHFVCPDHSYIGTNTRKAIHRQGGTEKGPRG